MLRRGRPQRDGLPASTNIRIKLPSPPPPRVRGEFGRLDLIVDNAAISNTRKGSLSPVEYKKVSLASNASLEEVRAVWETNVFGVLAVYQAMLPLLRNSSDARIVNVSSGVGSLTANSDPALPYRAFYSPVYPASKAALNAITLAMMIELDRLPSHAGRARPSRGEPQGRESKRVVEHRACVSLGRHAGFSSSPL